MAKEMMMAGRMVTHLRNVGMTFFFFPLKRDLPEHLFDIGPHALSIGLYLDRPGAYLKTI